MRDDRLAIIGLVVLAVAFALLLGWVTLGPDRAGAQDLRPFSPDQPAKASSTTTVDAGHFEAEMDAADWTSGAGVALGGLALKYGATSWADLELGVTACPEVPSCRWGDTALRAKIALTREDGRFTAAAIPGMTVGRDGTVTPVLALPVGYRVNGRLSLDATASIDGARRPVWSLAAGANYAVSPKLTATLELWGARGPGLRQETVDVALAWQPRPDLQWSVGGNFGEPRAEVYAGVAKRF